MKIRGFIGALIAVSIAATFALASVGKITAINGDVLVYRGDKTQKALANFNIEERDSIKSSIGSTAQILFNDNTIVTVGSNTLLKVEEYLFEDKNSKAVFRVEEGTFKTITGKIAKAAPHRFKVDTKMAAVGIRGTIFVGHIDSSDVLTIACLQGAIELTPTEKGFASKIVREGEVTTVSKKGIESPKKFTPQQIQNLERPLITLLRDKAYQTPLFLSQSKEFNISDLLERISSYLASNRENRTLGLEAQDVGLLLSDKPLESIQEAIAVGDLANKIDLATKIQNLKKGDFAGLPPIYNLKQSYPLSTSIFGFSLEKNSISEKLNGLDQKNIAEIINGLNAVSGKPLGAPITTKALQ